MPQSAMNGTRINCVATSRKTIPNEVFGANDDANLSADRCFVRRNGMSRC